MTDKGYSETYVESRVERPKHDFLDVPFVLREISDSDAAGFINSVSIGRCGQLAIADVLRLLNSGLSFL